MKNDARYFKFKNGGGMITVPPMDELCEALKTKFEDQESRIEYLQEELTKLSDEKWKDKELQKMQEELTETSKDASRGFPITEEEQKAIDEWIEKHEKEKHSYTTPFKRGGCIGGSYTYIFTPTSIGTFGTIKCSCGEEFCFSEI